MGKFAIGILVVLAIVGIVFGIPLLTEESLYDRTWISPAMVEISNYYPGGSASWSLRVHNGKDTEARFLVAYRVPDKVKEGYAMAPVEAGDWVIVADPTPILAPKETREIRITLVVPASTGAEDLPVTWEFWTSVIEVTGDMIQTEMCTRWLVSMRL